MQSSGFDVRLGLELMEVSGSGVTAILDVDDRHLQPYGLVHGGVYCSMVESLGSLGGALWAMEHGMVGAVGVSNATDFLRSHRTGRLEGHAQPVHQGRRQQLWQVEILRSVDKKLVARGQLRLHNLSSADEIAGAELTP